MLILTWHGHACFTIEAEGRRVIIDPFLTGNPAADIGLDKLPKIDAVLLSHGHGDHLGDTLAIAKRDRPTIISTFELASFCEAHGAVVHKMHLGRAREVPWGRRELVPALHGRAIGGHYAGRYPVPPSGQVPTIGGKTV